MGSYAYIITLNYCKFKFLAFSTLAILMFLQNNASDNK
jgi:hypothetical protein